MFSDKYFLTMLNILKILRKLILQISNANRYHKYNI